MTPLPKPSVDTGMGLERLAAVLQHVHSNYEIDLFQLLIKAAADATGATDLENKSLRVIADHIRSTAFMIVDGVLPSNEGRGYVLRRIIRRAIRHGYQLGQTQPFFNTLVEALDAAMGEAYPELRKTKEQVARVLKLEEERFAETLEHGMKVLEDEIGKVTDGVIPGETAFRLYDTYGFPVDLTADVAREKEMQVDIEGFEKEMEAQRQRARDASHFSVADTGTKWEVDASTRFSGYELLEDKGTVMAIYRDGQSVETLKQGEEGVVILDRTPFYAESGGQVGDSGELKSDSGASFTVTDTRKQSGDIFGHIGMLAEGELSLGDTVRTHVDKQARSATELNHSATHLMHAALREILGDHVQQKGSLVDPERLRFDFSHFEPVTREQLSAIERLVNAQIRANASTETRLMTLEDARQSGAMALFGEKYADEVRVLRIGDFSVELCGGTHVDAAGDIGLFRITSESGVASGVRRIEAVTGEAAIDLTEAQENQLAAISGMLKASTDSVSDKVEQLLARNRELEKELDRLKSKMAASAGSDLVSQAVEIAGIKVLAANLEGVDPKSLRDTLDQLKDKLGSGVVLLAASSGEKVNLIAGVTKDLTDRLRAGDLVRIAAEKVGGKGGGRPDMAQAGGNNPAGIPDALALVESWVAGALA
jgi:alanyl-tRNA synthetase